MSDQTENVEIETPAAGAAAEAVEAEGQIGAEQLAQMNALVEQFGALVERSEAAQTPLAEEEEEDEPEGLDLEAWNELVRGLPPESFTEDGSLTPRGLALLVRRESQAQVQGLLGQRDARENERAAAERRATGLEALEQRYPFMQDQENADKVVDAAELRAKQLGAATGVDYRILLREPAFIEDQIGRMYPEGAPAGAQTAEVPLERPGAASAASAGQELSEADRIVAAGARGRHSVGSG